MLSKSRALALSVIATLVLTSYAQHVEAGDGTSQLGLLPADTNIVLNLNVKRMRGGKALTEILSMASRNDDFKETSESLAKAGVKLERDIDTISMGMRASGTGDPDGIVVVVEGRFKTAKIIKQMRVKSPDIKKATHRGVAYYKAGDDGAFTFLGKNFVMAEGKRIKDVIDLYKKRGKSVAKSRKVKAMRSRTDTTKDLWFVAEMPKKKAGAGFGGPPMAEKIRTMTGSLDAKQGLDVKMRVGFTDTATPKEIVSQFEAVKPMAEGQLKQMGLDGVLDKAVLVADEKDVVFSVNLTPAEAEKIKALAQQAGGAI